MATETSARLRSGAVIAVAMGIMNLSTYGYTVLAAHTIGKEAYGAFSALMGALLVISVLSLGLQATGARRISAQPEQVVAIERVVLGVGLRSALVLGAVCLALAPVLNAVLHLNSLPTALMVGVAAFPLTYMGAQAGVLQGRTSLGAARAGLPRAGDRPGRVRRPADGDLADRVRRHGRCRARLLAARADRLARAAAPARRRTPQRGAPGPRAAPRGRAQQPGPARLLRPVERRHPGRPRDHVELRGRPLRRGPDHGQGDPVPAAVRGGLSPSRRCPRTRRAGARCCWR